MISRSSRIRLIAVLALGSLVVSACGGSGASQDRSRNSALPLSVAPKTWSPVCASFQGLENRRITDADEIVVTFCDDAYAYKISSLNEVVVLNASNRVLRIPARDLQVNQAINVTALQASKFTGGPEGSTVPNATVSLLGKEENGDRFIAASLNLGIGEVSTFRNRYTPEAIIGYAQQFFELNSPLWFLKCSNEQTTYSPNDPRGFSEGNFVASASGLIGNLQIQAKLMRNRILYMTLNGMREFFATGVYDSSLCQNTVEVNVTQDQVNSIRKYNLDLDGAICDQSSSQELIDGLTLRYQNDSAVQSLDRRAIMATDVSDSVALAASMTRLDILFGLGILSNYGLKSSVICPISRGSFQLGTDEIGEVTAFSNTTTTTSVPEIANGASGTIASSTLAPAPKAVTLKVGKTVATKAVIASAALPLKKGFAAVVSIGRTSSKVCSISGGKVKMKAPGTCLVKVAAKRKTGTTKSSLMTAKIITYIVTK